MHRRRLLYGLALLIRMAACLGSFSPLPGPRGRLVSLCWAGLGAGGGTGTGVSDSPGGRGAPGGSWPGVGALAGVASSTCATGVAAPLAPSPLVVGVSTAGAGDSSLARPPTWIVIFLLGVSLPAWPPTRSLIFDCAGSGTAALAFFSCALNIFY